MLKIKEINNYAKYLFTNLKFKIWAKKYIIIQGFPESTNFGDAINIFMVEYLSEKSVLNANYLNKEKLKTFTIYSVIGSIITVIEKGSVIWGSGLIIDEEDRDLGPFDVRAVRGPKTRNALLKRNVDCPEVYGDPALLLPYIYNPNVTPQYKFGIIPHYVDKKSGWIEKVSKMSDVLIIDIETGNEYEKIIKQLLMCEQIISSSLHGIIIAYAYKIPFRHVKFSDKIMGGNFKFDDFMLSVNLKPTAPLNIDNKTDFQDVFDPNFFINEFGSYNPNHLIEACPFISDDKRNQLQSRLNESILE